MNSWISLSNGKLKKPILRVGTFQKETDGTQFTFTQEHLDYFAGAFSHRIPTPLEHTTDPEKNRGWCVGMEVEGDVLNGIFELSDSIADPNIYDTSVYIPIVDGRVRPIEHVALTSYPVVDGLGNWNEIACSLMTPVKKKEESIVAVNWANLRTTLELSEDLTEENVVDVLTKRFQQLSEEAESLKLSNVQLTEKVKAVPPVINVEEIKQKKIFKTVKSSREAQIRALPLSKAAIDKLVEVYCTDNCVALALSEDDSQDTFDAVLSALKEHINLPMGEESGVQGLTLSDPHKSKETKEPFLVTDAKRRAGK